MRCLTLLLLVAPLASAQAVVHTPAMHRCAREVVCVDAPDAPGALMQCMRQVVPERQAGDLRRDRIRALSLAIAELRSRRALGEAVCGG